ncbi:hypothetical protein [Microbacterium sp. P05]|uniref:hypothetical protein n=1 Tax=Microbacterium sp. P05 TaxID=3366948 RepID=UPI003746B13F
MATTFEQAQQAILALNSEKLPFVYEPTPDGVRALWKYADVFWHSYIAGGKVDESYELTVILDAADSEWKFEESSSQSEVHFNATGLGMSKSWQKGPQKKFSFQKGAALHTEQTDRNGTEEGYVYGWKFTTDEVKAPVVEALTALGWKSGNGFFSRLFGG